MEQINYDGTSGFFLVDMVNMCLPPIFELALPVHHSPLNKELVSGILWNAAFCKIGDPSYNQIEFEGLPNIGKRMEMNGILAEDDFKDLKAIVFVIEKEEQKKFIGFTRASESDENLLNILYKICDIVNDDLNSRYFLGSVT